MHNDLTRTYQRAIDEAELVSFDVFDTLIHRVVFRPTHLFDLLSKRLGSTDLALRHSRLVAELPQVREQAEREARERHFRDFGTHEITLSDVYKLLQETFGLDDDVVQEIMEEELRLEQVVVYPNPMMKALYEYALANHKQVVLCSDMYLPKDQILGLLARAGFSPPLHLLVSGEIKKSKHEGSMFDLVCQQFEVPPDKMAHFGDNKHADFDVPMTKGIRAHHFNTVQMHTAPKLRFPSSAVSEDRAVVSLIQGAIQQVLLHDAEREDFWFDIGVQIFGPLFLGNFIWLMSNLRHDPVEKILFFARDGFFSHQLHQRYAADIGIDTPAEYVYFSRATLLVPSFTDLNIHRIWHLFSGRKSRTVGEHLARLDINPTLVRREMLDCGFASETDVVKSSNIPRMFDLLKRLYPFILETAKRRRKNVVGYVNQVAGSSKQIAIVDIGWTGNMQGSFSRLLQLSRNDFRLTGYYYGTFDGVTANYLPRNRYRSYLVSEGQPRNLYQPLMTGGVELMEFALMAPHGTTLGYEKVGGDIRPLLEDNPDDKKMHELSSRVQQGAMRFIEAAMPAILATGIEHWVSKTWSDPFFRLVNDPTAEEAELLGELTHSDTASDTVRRLPLAEKLDRKKIWLGGANYHEAYELAYWKKAFEIRNR